MFIVETNEIKTCCGSTHSAYSAKWLGNGLHDEGIEVRLPAEATDFSFLQSVHTGSEVHPVSYEMRTGVCFFGRREAEHLSPSSAEVKNAWK